MAGPYTKFLRGVVTSRRDVAPGLWVIRVRTEGKLAFRPGQYVAVGLPTDAGMLERPYSMASAPDEEEIEFFLELVPGGELTPRLFALEPGGELYLRRAAKGLFRYGKIGGRPNHFMVATVTGVAPFVSMLRDVIFRPAEPPARVVLVQGASLSPELGYAEELRGYARDHDWFTYVPTVSRIWLDPDWHGERGRAEDIIRKYLDAGDGFDPERSLAYLCGHPAMVAAGRGIFERAGFPAASIQEELYWQDPGAGERL